MAKTNKIFNLLPKIKFFIFLIFLLFLFPERANAAIPILGAIGSFILTTAATIATVSIIVILILQLLLGVMGLINTALANLISWSISPGALGNWSYTNNPIVSYGLEITGGFVSMGLILALVAIAFATILRLEGWDTKRLLLRLIVVALLVYFAPVICGFIVDAANIFMWHFAERIGGVGVLTTTFLNVALNLIRAFLGIPVLQQITTVASSFVQLIFQLYLALVLLMFFLLFTFRYVAIWIAVILSPIAFICWILPATRGYWEWWWKNFLQWVLAGPITAFFLYLGARAASEVSTAQWADPTRGFLAGFTLNPIAQIIPYLFPIGILNLGIILGIQGAGMGANFIFKWANKGMGYLRAAPSWAMRSRMGQRTMERLASITPGVERYLGRLEERAARVPIGGKALEATVRGIKRGVQMPIPYILRYAARARRVVIPKEFEEMSVAEQEAYVNALSSAEERIQFAAVMKKLGTLQKASKEFREKILAEAKTLAQSPYFKKEVGGIFDAFPNQMTKEMKIALALTPEMPPQVAQKVRREIEEKIERIANAIEEETKINPELNVEIEKIMRETGKTRQEVLSDIAAGVLHVREMSPRDIANVAKGSLDSVAFRLGMREATASKIYQLFENFDRETAEKVLEGPGGLNQLFRTLEGQPEKQKELLIKLHQENESLLRWFIINPAGRSIRFLPRDILEREYGTYENFLASLRKVPPERPKIIRPPERVPPRIVRRYEKREPEEPREKEGGENEKRDWSV